MKTIITFLILFLILGCNAETQDKTNPGLSSSDISIENSGDASQEYYDMHVEAHNNVIGIAMVGKYQTDQKLINDYDTDGDKVLNEEENRSALESVRARRDSILADEGNDLLVGVDTNADGLISLEEAKETIRAARDRFVDEMRLQQEEIRAAHSEMMDQIKDTCGAEDKEKATKMKKYLKRL